MPIEVTASDVPINVSASGTKIDATVSGGQGPAGSAGAAATISVGTVTTGAPGSSAAVVNAGTSSAAVFNFTIPAGAAGATGPQGPAGPAGTTTWAGITDKPSTFTPSAHTHVIADVTGLQTALDGKQASGSYAAASHTHDASAITAGTLNASRLPATVVRTGTTTDGVITVDAIICAPTPIPEMPADVALWTGTDGVDGTSGIYADGRIVCTAITLGGVDLATTLSGKAAVSHAHSAADVTSGTFDIARIPTGTTSTTVCIGNDARLSDARTPTAHNHSASEITSGVLATARLASSGTASATTFLRGDQTWAAAGSTNASDLVSGTLAYSLQANPTVTSPSQITANQNDYGSFARGINRFTTNAARDITGMVAGSDGEVRVLCNVGTTAANTLVIKDESASSTAANRFSVPWNGDCVIAAESSVVVFYDGTSSRWRVI